MSFCSDCGVELSHTETVCPLCRTRICKESESSCGAYPLNAEKVPQSSKHTAVVGLLMLFFPALICFAVDFLYDGLISWGPFIWGAAACLFAYAFLPKLFDRPKMSICIITDTVVTVGYLYLIGLLNGSTEWVLPLGLPITFLSGLFIFSVIKIAQLHKNLLLIKAAVVIGWVGILAVAVEVAIGLFKVGMLTMGWSLPVVIPSFIIVGILIYIDSNQELKKKILQKIFIWA